MMRYGREDVQGNRRGEKTAERPFAGPAAIRCLAFGSRGHARRKGLQWMSQAEVRHDYIIGKSV
jgi:hypothetical protein